MHKLTRTQPGPAGLRRYRHGKDKWEMGSPTPEERAEIWTLLAAMQTDRCAYCETQIGPDNRHIEHFHQRDRFPQGTFDWGNLFGSCMRQESCGLHKDRCGRYEPADLIQPDIDDPEDFLVFSPDGAVHPRANLPPRNHHRALETIRILNLNGVLRHIRHRQICGYVQTAEALAELAEQFPETECIALLEAELGATKHLPFATAIRHVLTRVRR